MWRKGGGPGLRPRKENARTGKVAPERGGGDGGTRSPERKAASQRGGTESRRATLLTSLVECVGRVDVPVRVRVEGRKRKKGLSACQPRRRQTHRDAQARTERSRPSAKSNFAVVVLCESRRNGMRRERQAEQALRSKRGAELTESRVAVEKENKVDGDPSVSQRVGATEYPTSIASPMPREMVECGKCIRARPSTEQRRWVGRSIPQSVLKYP